MPEINYENRVMRETLVKRVEELERRLKETEEALDALGGLFFASRFKDGDTDFIGAVEESLRILLQEGKE